MMSLRNYIHLIVPEYIPMAITTALVGYVSSSGALPGIEFLIPAIVISLIVSAFNAFNGVADKDIDRINKPERPIPSESLNEGAVMRFAATLYAAAFLLSLAVNAVFSLIALISIALTVSYSLPGIYLKKRFILGSLCVTVFYAVLCALAGWSLVPGNPVPFAIISFLFILGFGLSVSKDFMDVTGDKVHRAYTLPVKIGKQRSVRVIILLVTASFLFLLLMILQGFIEPGSAFLFALLPVMLYLVSRFRNIADAKKSNSNFKSIMAVLIVLELGIITLGLL